MLGWLFSSGGDGALAEVGDTGQGDGFGSKSRGLWDIRVNSLKMDTPIIHL